MYKNDDIIFVTGFPGFIGSRVITKLLVERKGARVTALVQEKFVKLAEKSIETLARSHPVTSGRIECIVGDITKTNLGLSKTNLSIQLELTEFFHFAAVYDLSVKRDLAMTVNVEGTRRIINFLNGCSKLKRHHYISTCYVCGFANAGGVFMENELDLKQKFKNYYEETKFLAEIEVRNSMDKIPTTIYRPGIVVGDSRTGETAKFDGPYYTFHLIRKLPKYSIMLKIGPGNVTVNLVPVDFVVDALVYLSGLEKSVGKTYQLADPNPKQVFELTKLFCQSLGKKVIYVPIPVSLAKIFMNPKVVQKLLGMPVEMLDYFQHQVHFDSTNTVNDLKGSGISCPDFYDYYPVLKNFALENKDNVAFHGMA